MSYPFFLLINLFLVIISLFPDFSFLFAILYSGWENRYFTCIYQFFNRIIARLCILLQLRYCHHFHNKNCSSEVYNSTVKIHTGLILSYKVRAWSKFVLPIFIQINVTKVLSGTHINQTLKKCILQNNDNSLADTYFQVIWLLNLHVSTQVLKN